MKALKAILRQLKKMGTGHHDSDNCKDKVQCEVYPT